MVEEIITALSRIHWLLVIARNSSFTYKGQAIDVKQVGRELGVRYVLEGSVRKAGGRVRITAQLIDAVTGTHLWADRFDGSLEDVFDLQGNVASSVAGLSNLHYRPPRSPIRLAARRTTSPPTTSTYTPTPSFFPRRDKSPKHSNASSKQSNAIPDTVPPSLGRRSATIGAAWTARARIRS